MQVVEVYKEIQAQQMTIVSFSNYKTRINEGLFFLIIPVKSLLRGSSSSAGNQLGKGHESRSSKL